MSPHTEVREENPRNVKIVCRLRHSRARESQESTTAAYERCTESARDRKIWKTRKVKEVNNKGKLNDDVIWRQESCVQSE